jgi:HPt (histidine-containing phosphotransfer) domain-containing protein
MEPSMKDIPGVAKEAESVGTPAQAAVRSLSSPVDLNVLKDLVGDSLEFIQVLLQTFRSGAEQSRIDIRQAIEADSFPAARSVAHKLRPSALSIGAHSLATACAEIEDATAGDWRLARSELLPRFEAEMQAVLDYLDHRSRTGFQT